MATTLINSSPWAHVSVALRAIVIGLAVAMGAANVWPPILLKLGMPTAAGVEVAFLVCFVWWLSGGGPPGRLRAIRRDRFRVRAIRGGDWLWGIFSAVAFAASVHAAIIVLFRIVPYPAAVFHHGYDLSYLPARSMQWIACFVSAMSAAICEEAGFRGYMQRPIEQLGHPSTAILVSSAFFTLVHFNKSWALVGMVPIVFAAGLMLGVLAQASETLVFCTIGHALMDVGLFAFWWTQIAGTFSQRPISESGFDNAFIIECGALLLLLVATWLSIRRLKEMRSVS